MRALGWLSEFTICWRDGVTNGNKCASFMADMWESSCPQLGDSAGVDVLGTVNGWLNARLFTEDVCGMGAAEWDECLMTIRLRQCPRLAFHKVHGAADVADNATVR